ncbi:hypothetical protein V2J09_020075, partial [Rumex salicifolius]
KKKRFIAKYGVLYKYFSVQSDVSSGFFKLRKKEFSVGRDQIRAYSLASKFRRISIMRIVNQKQLLCSLIPQSLSSFDFSVNKKLKSDDDGVVDNGFSGIVARTLLRWNANGRRWHQHNRRRRRHCLHFLPILTIFLVVALFSFLSLPIFSFNQNRRRLAVDDDGGAGGGLELNGETRDIWRSGSSQFYFSCSNASRRFLTADIKTNPDRYLLISTSGGLNQQRTGIVDAVVAAYILNATLLVPMLDQNSYWKDASDFNDIFDVDRFISFLSKDVKIIKQLPPVGGKEIIPVHTRVPRKCTPNYYLTHILPLLNKKHAVQLTKYDYRLANSLNPELQKLRCRVNYHALQFADPILEMGKKLVERMRMKSKHFIALHLRFEPDMLAFSGCDYGGGEQERIELGALRKRWKSLHKPNPEKQMRQGRCPLTPEQVGLMLRALGYGSDVHIYIASGEVYRGQETLAPLKALFPNLHSKDSIATKEELAPFASYSARMAALDYIVSDESDVFVTNNNGNMARILAGRRRYFGHKPTIRPNAKKLYQLFLNQSNIAWEEFASGVRTIQTGFMGEPNETRPGKGEFHENPESCICQSPLIEAGGNSETQNQSELVYNSIIDAEPNPDYQSNEDERAYSEDTENENEPILQ